MVDEDSDINFAIWFNGEENPKVHAITDPRRVRVMRGERTAVLMVQAPA